MRQHFNTDNIGPSYDMMILSDFRTFVAFSTAMFLQIRQKKTYFAEKVLNFYQRNLIQNPSWSHNNSQEPENNLFLSLLFFDAIGFIFNIISTIVWIRISTDSVFAVVRFHWYVSTIFHFLVIKIKHIMQLSKSPTSPSTVFKILQAIIILIVLLYPLLSN